MPDIYIIEKASDEAERIKESCVNYLISANREAAVRIIESCPHDNRKCIYIIGFDSDTEKIAKEIRSDSSGYILVVLDDISQLPLAVSPAVAPSGFLVRPSENKSIADLLSGIYTDYERMSAESGQFRFKVWSKEYSVPFDKIVFFESGARKVVIRTISQEIECNLKMESILEAVPDNFVRIHKSYIVNIDYISNIDYPNMTVKFSDGSLAFISRTYKSRLKERFSAQ